MTLSEAWERKEGEQLLLLLAAAAQEGFDVLSHLGGEVGAAVFEFVLDQGGRVLDGGGGDHGFQHGALELIVSGLLGLFAEPIGDPLAERVVGFELVGDVDGEIVVGVGQFLGADGVNRELDGEGLAGGAGNPASPRGPRHRSDGVRRWRGRARAR